MIVKRVDSKQRRRAAETTAYIMDKAHDGEKLLDSGMVNCFSESMDGAQAEISADEKAYQGQGDPVMHWIVSWQTGENPTPEQCRELANQFLADQGMADHKCVWALHGNTEHTHMHLAVLRVKPEADESGNYTIQHHAAKKNGIMA